MCKTHRYTEGMEPDESIALSLGIILGRGFRSDLYQELTADISDGLTKATYPLLSALQRANEPSSAASLAPVLGLDRSVISKQASELINAGLIATSAATHDRRQVLLTLTAKGQNAIKKTRRRLYLAIARHIAHWSSSEQELFAELLSRFTEAPLGKVD